MMVVINFFSKLLKFLFLAESLVAWLIGQVVIVQALLLVIKGM